MLPGTDPIFFRPSYILFSALQVTSGDTFHPPLLSPTRSPARTYPAYMPTQNAVSLENCFLHSVDLTRSRCGHKIKPARIPNALAAAKTSTRVVFAVGLQVC